MVHELKCQPPYFQSVLDNRKTFELRREGEAQYYQVGDTLVINEFDPKMGYTGRFCTRLVTYLVRGPIGFDGYEYLPPGMVILGLMPEGPKAVIS